MMFDRGTGTPLVVIPGVQGRWEWMRPTLDALARRRRTISYSLDRASRLDELTAQLDRVLDGRGIDAAAICGVSFGGVVALRYAATRPARTRALILVSAPSPSWRPTPRQARYLSRPWLSTPAFVATSPLRLWPEIRSALGSPAVGMRFAVVHAARVAAHPIVPAEMASRMSLVDTEALRGDCAHVTARTLVVTGEEKLDRVVPAALTREYAVLIRGARHVEMRGTGHIGLITQPERFATIVNGFIDAEHS